MSELVSEGTTSGWVLGIDEAGRGPVLGPLVLGAVRIHSSCLEKLDELGVRDSKSIGSGARAHERRRELAEAISTVAEIGVAAADAEEVDRWTCEGGLNRLEHHLATRLIEAAPCEVVWADGARLFDPLRARFPMLRAEDKADVHHTIVAAASIVAKVERDERLARIFDRYTDEVGALTGGGYPNAATARWMRAFVERFGALPPGVRRSWSWSVLEELERACDADPKGEGAS